MPAIPTWFDDAGLSLRACRVLVHLWRRRGCKVEGRCYPSATSIAKWCGISRPTVFAALAELERAGLLVRKRSGSRGSNEYFLAVPTSKENGTTETDQALRKQYATSQKNDTSLVKNPARKGIPEREYKEGRGRQRRALSLSEFQELIKQVEAMPEFENRTDVARIAEIIGPEYLRNASHLAARVRDEHMPAFRKKGDAFVPLKEPSGWREWSAQKWPQAIFNDPQSDRYASTWSQVDPEYQAMIVRGMAGGKAA